MSEEISLNVAEERDGWFSSWFRWCPTSPALLIEAEKSLMSNLKKSFSGRYVNVGKIAGYSESNIWTVCMNKESCNTPIVLLHGFGCSVGLWCLNLDSLAADRPVYAIDILGFGRSSRPSYSTDPLEAEREFIASIEAWRWKIGLEKFILMGHSFGGFLAASYAIKHPERISHLILADPWGFSERPLDISKHYNLPFWVKIIVAILQPFNPLFIIRAAGPLGPFLLKNARSDLTKKFASIVQNYEEVIPNYLYHCNAQNPSGETAFHNLMSGFGGRFGWAKHPMINRIDALRKGVPITLIYGSRSWVDQDPGFQIKYNRKDSFVDVKVLSGAGHHVYADQAETFNKLVSTIGEHVDNGTLPTISPEDTEYNHKVNHMENISNFISRITSRNTEDEYQIVN